MLKWRIGSGGRGLKLQTNENNKYFQNNKLIKIIYEQMYINVIFFK